MSKLALGPLLLSLIFMSGCATRLPPLKTVERVDLSRYMGPWYIIAAIPTFIETEAYNGIETYRLEHDEPGRASGLQQLWI